MMVTGGLRVKDDDEFAGLGLSQHSENAHTLGAGGSGGAFAGAHGARPAMAGQHATMGIATVAE